MAIDKAEYLKALNTEREAICAKLLDLESRIDEIDSEITNNTEPPDVSKMPPLQRAAYEDSQRLCQTVARSLAEKSPFLSVLDGGVFPKGAGRVCQE